jgi:hypothetical protein
MTQTSKKVRIFFNEKVSLSGLGIIPSGISGIGIYQEPGPAFGGIGI